MEGHKLLENVLFCKMYWFNSEMECPAFAEFCKGEDLILKLVSNLEESWERKGNLLEQPDFRV